jgi:hypothetical protein
MTKWISFYGLEGYFKKFHCNFFLGGVCKKVHYLIQNFFRRRNCSISSSWITDITHIYCFTSIMPIFLYNLLLINKRTSKISLNLRGLHLFYVVEDLEFQHLISIPFFFFWMPYLFIMCNFQVLWLSVSMLLL